MKQREILEYVRPSGTWNGRTRLTPITLAGEAGRMFDEVSQLFVYSMENLRPHYGWALYISDGVTGMDYVTDVVESKKAVELCIGKYTLASVNAARDRFLAEEDAA